MRRFDLIVERLPHAPSSSYPCSDDRQGRKDAKAQLLALPELRHAVYSCVAIACGVVCFANGTSLPPMNAFALALLPAFGELIASIVCARELSP